MAQTNQNQDLASRVRTMTNSQGPVNFDKSKVLNVLVSFKKYDSIDISEGRTNQTENPYEGIVVEPSKDFYFEKREAEEGYRNQADPFKYIT